MICSVSILLLSPSINYVLFCFAPCYMITLGICVFHFDQEKSFLLNMFGWLIGLTIFWLVLQKRELKRFYEKQDAKIKETKATEKQVELTNVLNRHQDVVIVYTTEEAKVTNDEDLTTPRALDLSIEFSNNRSMDVFGIDLS